LPKNVYGRQSAEWPEKTRGRSLDSPTNYLHEWVSRHSESAIKGANEHDPSTMIAALSSMILMGTSDVFGPRPKQVNTENDHEIRAHFVDIIQRYNNDYCLFEVCCYILFRLDVWLFRKDHTAFREKQFRERIVNSCLAPFKASLKGDNLSDVFNARLEAFGRLLLEENNSEEQTKREQMMLLQFIYESERLKKVFIGDPGSPPHLIRGMSDAFIITARISSNVESYFSTYTRFLEDTIKSIAEHERIKN
jgi:hypothetical protein